MTVDTTARHSGGSVETFSCEIDAQDLLLIYSDALTLSRGDFLS